VEVTRPPAWFARERGEAISENAPDAFFDCEYRPMTDLDCPFAAQVKGPALATTILSVVAEVIATPTVRQVLRIILGRDLNITSISSAWITQLFGLPQAALQRNETMQSWYSLQSKIVMTVSFLAKPSLLTLSSFLFFFSS
jgi:hypothetical protein